MRRATTVLVTAMLTTGGMAALAPPAAASEIVPRDLTITVTGLGPEKRTCRIDADLYVPAGVTSQRPAPALLATNGFGGTKDDQAALAQGFGEHGYVTLSYTGLGFVDGDNCPITLDDREHDGAAAAQLVRFLGGDPSISAVDDVTEEPVRIDQVVREDGRSGVRHDPQVGMTGGSYGGQVQFATAGFEKAARAGRLDAIVPLITWNDLSYSLAPENSRLPQGTARSGSVSSSGTGVFKYQWAALFTSVGVLNGAQDLQALLADPARFTAYFQQAANAENCANFEPEVCRALGEVAAVGYPSPASIEYLRSNSVASYMRDVRVPTLIGQGQADTLFNLQESVATYTALERQGTPVSLMWQSWGHSSSTPKPGELDMRHPAQSLQGRAALAWFDHYVRDRGPRPPQGFAYYRDWVYEATGGDITKAYATARSYPVGTERTYHLSGSSVAGADGSLVGSRTQVVPSVSAYSGAAPIGPNYTETSALDQTGPVTDPPGTAIRFATPALTRAVDVVGSPRLTVQLDAPSVRATQAGGPAGQLVVYAKVYDIAPDGKTVELPNRLISPVRVTDVTRPITVELPAIVHRFAPGHRLAVVLAGGDLAYRGSTVPQPVTLTTGPGRNQQLTVPVVG
ncbi:CocE/NonD family hydrolase [Blastococcus haudaquaticus]|uniref:ABC-2 type transport system ATP-binding protein n=1 Tax=Blastococcus haudaquaticus TaxID=1938745 RepID=A0A286GEJ1_9ACTN|nr:CocE/NonD family hydrolase [Blastococcus haudaquaticus]SOD93945.1 ABC-2 type transport system ATP-binding protein [Blastococcus haudaquaticus]